MTGAPGARAIRASQPGAQRLDLNFVSQSIATVTNAVIAIILRITGHT
jgi:hypothetical protein